MKNFKLAVYISMLHLRQKGQVTINNTPSEASSKYNTITVKSQTVTKADCVGSLWCLLVLNLAVGGRSGEVSFSPHTLPLPPFFSPRNNNYMLRAITRLETLASCYPGCYWLLIITITLVHAPTSSWTPQ